MARKPMVGDQIEFERQQQDDGKVRAKRANIEGVAILSSTTRPVSTFSKHSRKSEHQYHKNQHSSSFINRLIPLLIIIGLGIFGFNKYEQMNEMPVLTNEDIEKMKWTELTSGFQCEAGKTHCSQLRTCAEATFYIKHCPGTQMDGDNDGVPCEHQHCG
jgi:hypothetical protein